VSRRLRYVLPAIVVAASAAWLVGCDAQGWCQQNVLPTASTLSAIHGVDREHVWAVGSDGVVVAFDGAAWSAVPSGVDVRFADVWASGPDDVWALDRYGSCSVLRFDGSQWRADDLGLVDRDARDLWGADRDHVWMAGESEVPLLHHDGARVSRLEPPGAPSLTGIAGDGAGRLWAVGDGGEILARE